MHDEIKPIPEGIETDTPVIKQGTVKFMSKAGFMNTAPKKLRIILTTLRYFCTGLITMIGATDLFSGKQAKIFCFILGVVILACGAIEGGTGVQSVADAKKELEDK